MDTEERKCKDPVPLGKAAGMEWGEVLARLAALPPETPEEIAERERKLAEFVRNDRMATFRAKCPPEFMQRIDRGKLTNPAAFDAVAGWNGRFRGILAHGQTGGSKTRAVWSALGRAAVEDGRTFVWFTAKRLITEFVRYESKDLADEFWRHYRAWDIIFVDDLDKFNVQFESEGAAMFAFYDWAYREHRAVITTTNKSRSWWEKLMGEAFTRRLFDEVHTAIEF